MQIIRADTRRKSLQFTLNHYWWYSPVWDLNYYVFVSLSSDVFCLDANHQAKQAKIKQLEAPLFNKQEETSFQFHYVGK